MNEEILKGKWRELKGGMKERWGKLTDDDLTAMEGKSEKIVGMLQQKYGWSREQAEREFQDFFDTDKGRSGRS